MELKLKIFKQSLESFNYLVNVDYESLQSILDPRLIDGLENGLVQKFEIVTEQSWKLVKAFLLKNEGVDSKTPKQAVKGYYKAGYLNEDNYLLWIQALDDRNSLSHRYNEKAYQMALDRMSDYVKLF
ncbi:Nucleotidyltransferase substrate binding protein, HI0074 [Beggiatoa sp. PS]|nr:Nucleotidyltransferase substrate binding protein, HI0074 [Beggiatoa sp. PS]